MFEFLQILRLIEYIGKITERFAFLQELKPFIRAKIITGIDDDIVKPTKAIVSNENIYYPLVSEKPV